MNGNLAKWGLSQLIALVMLVIAGTAFAAGEALVHNSNNVGTKYGVWGVAGGKYGEFTCTTCHSTTTDNIKRVSGTITAPLGNWSSSKSTTVSVVFNNLTGFGTDASAHTSSTQICQVCHSKTAVHRYDKPVDQAVSNHQNANQQDCTQCHSHAKAFAPACNSCHGYPPSVTTLGSDGLVNPATHALGASPSQPGAHVSHDVQGMKCTTCHNGFDGPTHMTSGKIEIGFAVNNTNWGTFTGPAAGSGSFVGTNSLNTSTGGTPASYSWQGNGGTSVTTAAATTTCNVYCHGGWTGANGGSDTSWVGGSAEKDCGACHGASAATTPTTNAHVRHAGTLSTTSLGVACASCHGSHAGTSHVNGDVSWNLGSLSNGLAGTPQYKKAGGSYAASGTTGGLAPSVTVGQCNTVYCHSNVQGASGTGAPTLFAQPLWSDASVTCDSCHGASGAFRNISTGSHRTHVTVRSLSCDTCHNAAGHDTVNHANGTIEVSMTAGTYTNAGKSAGVGGFGTCSNNAGCHNNAATAPTWGGTIPGDCNGCHGNEATAATRLSGAHNAHLNFNQVANGGFKCKDCHSPTITNADNRTIAVQANHPNNTVDYAGTYAGTNKNCSNIYCHSNGSTASRSITYAAIPGWTSATNLTCDGCHPKDGLTGAHKVHMGSLDFTAASTFYNMTANRTLERNDVGTNRQHGFGCAECHPIDVANHLNGTVDVDLNRVNVSGVGSLRMLNHSTATYGMVSDKKCSNIYCHSNASRVEKESNVKNNTSLAWTDTFAAHTDLDRCAMCHDNQPWTGAHAAHSVGNHYSTDFEFKNRTSVSRRNLLLTTGVTTFWNIYNGISGKVPTKVGGNTGHGNTLTSTTISCYICHFETVNTAKNDTNFRCAGCHLTGAYGAEAKGVASISNLANHVNGKRDVHFNPIKVISKAQIRPVSFKFYSGVWVRNYGYKNMTTLGFDTAKNALDTATMWHPSTPMASNCTNIACHNGRNVSWNLANFNDPNKCMDCHNQL